MNEFPKMLTASIKGDDDIVRVVPVVYRRNHPTKQGFVIFASREEEDQFRDDEGVVSSGEPEQHSAPAPTWPYVHQQPFWIDHLHQHSSDRTP
jgi:hypothetical protein